MKLHQIEIEFQQKMKQQELKQIVAANHEALHQDNEWQAPTHVRKPLKKHCVQTD